MIIDASGATVGRLASFVAKKALGGEEISIINSEKAIITGNKKMIFEKYRTLRQKGGDAQKGPYFPRSPEQILKRIIRGMIPDHREGQGRMAFKRIKCYLGIPEEFKDKPIIKTAKPKRDPYVELKEVSQKI